MSRGSTDPAGRDRASGAHGEEGRPVAPLSRTTLMAMRRLLHAFREGWVLEQRLAMAARMAVVDAREAGLEAERLVIALKAQWAMFEEVRALPGSDVRYLRDRLVSLSILAYYESERGPGAAAAPGGRAELPG